MSTFYGADVGGLRQLARDFSGGSGRVGEIALAVDSVLSGTAWQGPDRDAFEAMWMTALRPALLACGDALETAGTTLVANADQQDAASAVDDTVAGPGGTPAATPAWFGAAGAGGTSIPSWWTTTDLTGLTPDEIRAQWDLLTDAQRQALIESDPLLYGNLDGIPLGWRANANEINVRNEIARLEGEIADLEGKMNPADRAAEALFGWMNTGGIQGQIDERQEKIDAYQALLGPQKANPEGYDDPDSWRTLDYGPDGKIHPYNASEGWPKGSQLILFDPANSRIASYHGTFTKDGDIPSTYENVVTYVPGTGTQPWKWDGPAMRGSQMHVDANRQGGSTAVIVWSDGPQPQNIDAITPGYAQNMGPKLVAFSGVNVPENSTYTVVGHSYGATNVAQAEAAGLTADRVLYVAPAGYGQAPDGHMVSGLDDFPHTGDVPHYVMISRTDPVVGAIQDGSKWYDFGIHGDSPKLDSDITRLETGWLYDRPPGPDTHGKDWTAGYLDEHKWESHSTPFEYYSTAHQNMIEVITGGTAQGYAGEFMRGPFDPNHPKDFGFEQGDNGYVTRGPRYDENDWPDVPIQ